MTEFEHNRVLFNSWSTKIFFITHIRIFLIISYMPEAPLEAPNTLNLFLVLKCNWISCEVVSVMLL